VRPCGNLLESRDAGQQSAEDIRSLQHRSSLEIRTRRWIHSLYESLKYFTCSLFLHDATFHGY